MKSAKVPVTSKPLAFNARVIYHSGRRQKSVFKLVRCVPKRKKCKDTHKKLSLHLLAVLQQPTEQLVLSLLVFVMILQDSLLEAEKRR